jgi:hypothetical protein
VNPAPPPAPYDNNPYDLVSGNLGELVVNGKTLLFAFTANQTLTVTGTGTVVLGTGSANAIPYFVDANTLGASNLAMSGANILTLAADGVSTVTAPRTGKMAVDTISALTPGANVAMNCNLGNRFTLTPGETETITPSGGYAGMTIILEVVTSGVTSYTLTFATNFKGSSTLATGTTTAKKFLIEWYFDGTDYIELKRTTAL